MGTGKHRWPAQRAGARRPGSGSRRRLPRRAGLWQHGAGPRGTARVAGRRREDAALDRARPVLDALGSSVLHVGRGVEGSALKLAVNAWMTAATVAMSDVLALCDALGIDHATFVTALEAGPLAMPYELQKVSLDGCRHYPAGFAVQLALKDIDLAAELAVPSPLLQVVRDRLEQAVAAGHGSDDLAAVDYVRKSAVTGAVYAESIRRGGCLAMSRYIPAAGRYESMQYRRCGRSGLLLAGVVARAVAQLR